MLRKEKFSPERCFGMDEPGTCTVPAIVSNSLTTKGKRNVSEVNSGENGQRGPSLYFVISSRLCVLRDLILSRKRRPLNLFKCS
jgi:hypothetical protein